MAYTLSTVTAPSLVPTPGAPIEAVLGTGVPQVVPPGTVPGLDTDGVLLYEALATDYRTTPVASPLYLLAFNRLQPPVTQTVPFLPAIEIVGFADLDFTGDSGPMVFDQGCWIAISSTPQSYTPISSDAFSLMLRTGS